MSHVHELYPYTSYYMWTILSLDIYHRIGMYEYIVYTCVHIYRRDTCHTYITANHVLPCYYSIDLNNYLHITSVRALINIYWLNNLTSTRTPRHIYYNLYVVEMCCLMGLLTTNCNNSSKCDNSFILNRQIKQRGHLRGVAISI